MKSFEKWLKDRQTCIHEDLTPHLLSLYKIYGEECYQRLIACEAENEELTKTIQRMETENAALHARIDKFDDLHIHMGKPVYIITDDNEIVERFICGIHILSTEIIFVTTTNKNYKPCKQKGIAANLSHCLNNKFGLISLRYFGERAFTDRDIAEKHLAEEQK